MKAENTKERKREEKERKGKDLVWLIFKPSTSADFGRADRYQREFSQQNRPRERIRSVGKPLFPEFHRVLSGRSCAVQPADAFHSCPLSPETTNLVVAQFNGKFYRYPGVHYLI